MKQAGGAVQLESAEGVGTVFTLIVPPSESPTASATRAVRRRPAITERDTIGRVLVVEDDAALRRMLTRVVAQLQYDVASAGSAEEARAILRAGERPDLLVTDTVMPGASGIELAQELLAEDRALRVLFISGYPDDDREPEPRRADPRVGYLDKPFTIGQLADAITDLANATIG